MRTRNFTDLTGQRFGRWTVLRRSENKRKLHYWECSCSCGTIKNVYAASLRCGRSLSCGCLHKDNLSQRNKKHGMSRTVEYNTWNRIIDRCTNENNQDYHHYGGRGISIDERWRNSFEAFYDDMGPRPSSKHSIDRIDVNGNYEPGNCRWVTFDIQSQNKRANTRNKTGIRGITLKDGKFAVRITINKNRLWIGSFNTLLEAIEARKQAEKKYWGKSS